MAFGLIVVACAIGGSCTLQAPLMYGAGSAQVECSAARKTEVLNGIAAVVANAIPDLTRGDANAIVPIADALRARRIERLILRCVEWPPGGSTRPGRTVGEDSYAGERLARLLAPPPAGHGSR